MRLFQYQKAACDIRWTHSFNPFLKNPLTAPSPKQPCNSAENEIASVALLPRNDRRMVERSLRSPASVTASPPPQAAQAKQSGLHGGDCFGAKPPRNDQRMVERSLCSLLDLCIYQRYYLCMNTIHSHNNALPPEQREALLRVLKARFEKNIRRHPGLAWAAVQARLEANPEKLGSLNEMERTGGEPDVVGQDELTGEMIFYDCAPESPAGRRNLCFDREALDLRKANKPEGSALELAAAMGIELLSEEQYRELQKLGEFDTKTSSWVITPAKIRKLGGALYADRRYDTVFIYHNGAPSYYAARGFRGWLRV